MKIFITVADIRKAVKGWRNDGLSVALVPTMGYFHEGHLSLMRAAGERADRVIVSLFVNPSQFGPGEDLESYPRDLERDARMAEKEGVDCIFHPDPGEMYPDGFQTWIEVSGLSQGLCGALRPGHFRGVATVVAKLLNIVQPDLAVFGEKDFQQLLVIRRMVRDLNLPVEIVAHPIVREHDGLAMSSRNAYLTQKQRKTASCLFGALKMAQGMVSRGRESGTDIILAVEDFILSHPDCEIDYVFLGDPENLQPVEKIHKKSLLALAVRIGKTRLIDNAVLLPPEESATS